MSRSPQVRRFTTIAIAGMLGLASVPVAATAQRPPRVGTAGRPAPPPPQMTVPYPGATVTVDPQLYQLWYQQQYGQRPLPQHRPPHQRPAAPGSYVPVPYPVYPYYPGAGGGVTDANGRPLYIPSESAPSQGGYGVGTLELSTQGGYGLGTPDLSGSAYVADANGRMLVDFGRGVRAIPSCAAESAQRSPDGRPRTIFYQPAAGGIVLREGQRGRVIGVPPTDAKACYLTDAYGRMTVDWE